MGTYSVLALNELEERIEATLFTDWREAGERLAQIRDEELYRPEYRSFAAYVETRYRIHRATAYSYMAAAEVARSLSSDDDTRLPQRHCQLLYRFSPEARVRIARELVGLSFEEAAKLVRARAAQQEEPIRGRPKPRHAANPDLAALHRALRIIRELDETALARSLGTLDVEARRVLDGEIGVAVRRLNKARRFRLVATSKPR